MSSRALPMENYQRKKVTLLGNLTANSTATVCLLFFMFSKCSNYSRCSCCLSTVHYYNYYANSWNCSSFSKPRMSTEYGFQALPSVHSWETVADPSNEDDWSFNGALLSNRQHHPLGNFEMKLQVSSRLGLPKSNLSSRKGLEDMIYLTQVKM